MTWRHMSLLLIFSVVCGFWPLRASAFGPENVASGDPAYATSPPRQWLVVARAHALGPTDHEQENSEKWFSGEMYLVKIDHVEVIVGPSDVYDGPLQLALRINSIPYLQDGEIYLVIEERSEGDATVLEWSRVMREACVRPSHVPHGYERAFQAASTEATSNRCVSLDDGRIDAE